VTGLGIGLIELLPPAFAIFPLLGLIFNTAVSVGDLYAVWQLLRAGPRAVGTAWGIYAPAAASSSEDGRPSTPDRPLQAR